MPDSDDSGSIKFEDRRTFGTQGGGGQDVGPETPSHGPASDQQSASKDAADECGESPRSMPKIDFTTFVLSLASSASMHMGDMSHPETGEAAKNLPMAKESIDILGVLQEKTRGNLTKEEDHLLTELLYDLRLRYVSVCKGS